MTTQKISCCCCSDAQRWRIQVRLRGWRAFPLRSTHTEELPVVFAWAPSAIWSLWSRSKPLLFVIVLKMFFWTCWSQVAIPQHKVLPRLSSAVHVTPRPSGRAQVLMGDSLMGPAAEPDMLLIYNAQLWWRIQCCLYAKLVGAKSWWEMSHSLSSALTQGLYFCGILMLCIAVCFYVVMRHVMAACAGMWHLSQMKWNIFQ